ncbi:VWA domain-containing protein [Longispora sp. NPDC051575]|uniref:VWA domain-containing protein n=1 Tax=Longispora sp. NPDC051575 TaxID=3154943 RepID=UPI00344A0D41
MVGQGGPRRAWVPIAVFAALSAIGGWLVDLPTREAPTLWFWVAGVVLVLGTVGSVLVDPLAADFDLVLRKVGRGAAPVRRLLPYALAVALIVTAGYLVLPFTLRTVALWTYGCAYPEQLQVLTTPDGLAPAREVADAYEERSAVEGCPTVSMYVYAAPTDRARVALASEWSAEHRRERPRPDVWLPDSSLEVAAVRADLRLFGRVLDLGDAGSLGSSPLVLGVPEAAVPITATERRNATTWRELLADARSRDWGLLRASPGRGSGPAALATTVLYPGADPRDIERWIDRTLDAGGYPIDDAAGQLCRLRELGPGRTAVVASERDLVRLNRGDPVGDRCGRTDTPSTLVLYYPTDTRSLDHPFVALGWTDTTAVQRRTVAAFRDWLTGDEGQRALAGTGLRPRPGHRVSAPVDERRGALPGANVLREPPAQDTVAATLGAYDLAHRGGRVLLAVDSSGSMAEPVSGARGSRFDVAREAVRGAFARMGPRDTVGVWTFAGAGLRELTPVGPRPPPTADPLAGVSPAGATPLYPTIAAGVATLRAGRDDSAVAALVVVTDGEDTSGTYTAARLLDEVRGGGVRVFVVAVGEAHCGGAVAEVTAATGGACRETGFATVDATMRDVFGAVWGGGRGDR